MQITSTIGQLQTKNTTLGIKNLYTEKLTKEETKELKAQIVENANAFTFQSTTLQSSLGMMEDDFAQAYEEFQSFLEDIGYTGKAIGELSQDEASELVSEDGFFGISQTSERIANFVIDGANGDEGLLRAGREGMLQGFDEAQELWGGELPDISQKTMQRATELVDRAMHDLGYSILDKEA